MFHGESKSDYHQLSDNEQANLKEQAFTALKAFYEAINKGNYEKANDILHRNKDTLILIYQHSFYDALEKGFEATELLQNLNQPEPLISDVIITPIPEIKADDNLNYTDNLINRRLQNRVRPLSKTEYLIFFTATGAAVGSSSTAYHFSRNFIRLFSPGKMLENMLALFTTPPAFAAQFAFTLRTNLNFDSQVARYLTHEFKHLFRHGSFDELRRDFWPFMSSSFGTIIPSAMAAVATGYRTFKNIAPTGFLVAQGLLRFKGAGVSNATFAQRYAKDKLIEKNKAAGKCYALTTLIENIRDRLQLLAINYPLSYIHALNSGFFDIINSETSFSMKVDALIEMHELLNRMEIERAQRQIPRLIEIASVVLGMIPSLMNVAATRYVPDIFGLPYVDNIIDFFSEMANEAPSEWKTAALALFIICLIYMGKPSGLSNTLINGQSTRQTLRNALDVYDMGYKKYFSAYSKSELRRFKILCVFSVCFGGMSGGNFYGYPFIDWRIFTIGGALITAVIFSFNSHVWLKTFINTIDDTVHRALFTNFAEARDKLAYYNEIEPAEKSKLIGLIDNYFTIVFTGLIDDINELAINDDLNVYSQLSAIQIDELVRIAKEIDEKRGTPQQPQPAAEQKDAPTEQTVITVEPSVRRQPVLSILPLTTPSNAAEDKNVITIAHSEILPTGRRMRQRSNSLFISHVSPTIERPHINQPVMHQPRMSATNIYNLNTSASPLGGSPTIFGDRIKPNSGPNKKIPLHHNPSSRVPPPQPLSRQPSDNNNADNNANNINNPNMHIPRRSI